MESAAIPHPRAAILRGLAVLSFKAGDVVPNKVGWPITIEAVEADYYIGSTGMKWVDMVGDDGAICVTPYQGDDAQIAFKVDNSAAHSTNGNGKGPQAPPPPPPNPRFNVGDKVHIVINGQLQTMEPAEVARHISPVMGQWGYALIMPDGSEALYAEINLEPATAEDKTAQATNGSGPAVGDLPPSSLPRPMSELLAHQFKPQIYLVDDLIAKGHLVILGGRPKSGKSWLGLQLAKCIDTGADFLGRETTKAKVLYYALEDGERRVQARAKAIDWQPQSAAVLFTIPYLDDGQGGYGPGVGEIANYASDYDLIIVDTLIAAMSGRTDERDNSAMGKLINALAYVAHKGDKAIVVVHHTGKAANPDDIFATFRGASAIRGAYDVGLILERKPGEREAILHTESRDLDIRNMTLRQADDGAGWVYMGDAYELEKIRAGRKVLEALLEHDASGEGMTAKQIAEIRKVTEATIGRQLARLEADGYVCRDEQPSTQMGKKPDIWLVKAEYR